MRATFCISFYCRKSKMNKNGLFLSNVIRNIKHIFTIWIVVYIYYSNEIMYILRL